MTTDGDGDVTMTDAPVEAAPVEAEPSGATETADAPMPPAEGAADVPAADAAPAEPARPTPDVCVAEAEAAKEAGNALLKAGDSGAARAKYAEGIDLTEHLLGKDPGEVGEELQQRGTLVYIALRLNSAQASLKSSDWVDAIEHSSKVLLLEKDNPKALYRRGMAAAQLDTEGRLEEARADFLRVTQLDPSNREAREQLQKAKDRLKDLRQREKERLSLALKGGLYKEQHDKLGRQQAAYAEEMLRRKEAGEAEVTFEEWTKSEKDKEEELRKKQKEEMEKQLEAAQREQEERKWKEENAKRVAEGQEEISLEDWKALQRAQQPRRTEEVVRTEEVDLDEEERRLLEETKSKGYYHGRLNTVPSAAAPTPQQLAQSDTSVSPMSGADGLSPAVGSEWNQAGTWEAKDTTTWAKDRLTNWLQNARVEGSDVSLPSGSKAAVSCKVSKVKSLEGDAQIVVVRKQLKHGFNFEAELSFRFKVLGGTEGTGDESFGGVLGIHELMDAVPAQELKADVKWSSSSGPSEVLLPLAREWVEKLIENVRLQVAGFREEYSQRR